MPGNVASFSLDTAPGDHRLAESIDKFTQWRAGNVVHSTGRRVGSLLVPAIRQQRLADELAQWNDTMSADELSRQETLRSQLIAPLLAGFMLAAKAYWKRCGWPGRCNIYTNVSAGDYRGQVSYWHSDYLPKYDDIDHELALTCSFGAGATVTTSGEIDRSQIDMDGKLHNQNAVGKGGPLQLVTHKIGDIVAFSNAGDIHRSPPIPSKPADRWRLFMRLGIELPR